MHRFYCITCCKDWKPVNLLTLQPKIRRRPKPGLCTWTSEIMFSVLECDGSQSFQRKEQGHKDTQDTQGHRIHRDYISNF